MNSIGEFPLTKKNNYIRIYPSDSYIISEQIKTVINLTPHHQWVDNNCNIAWIINTKEYKTFADKSSFMKIKKVGDVDKVINEVDYIIVINYCFYQMVEEKQQIALLDDIYSRILIEEDEKSDDVKYKLAKPDVIEFAGVVKRHGAYFDNIKSFINNALREGENE